MVGHPISLRSCSLVIKMSPHVRERNGMLPGALGFPLPLLRLRLSSGRPTPCSRLVFHVGSEQKDIGKDRFLFELSLVSTYHYKSFQNIKFNKELIKMFLARPFAAVLVGIMYESDTAKSGVNHSVANDVFIRLVELVASLHKQTQKVIH